MVKVVVMLWPGVAEAESAPAVIERIGTRSTVANWTVVEPYWFAAASVQLSDPLRRSVFPSNEARRARYAASVSPAAFGAITGTVQLMLRTVDAAGASAGTESVLVLPSGSVISRLPEAVAAPPMLVNSIPYGSTEPGSAQEIPLMRIARIGRCSRLAETLSTGEKNAPETSEKRVQVCEAMMRPSSAPRRLRYASVVSAAPR